MRRPGYLGSLNEFWGVRRNPNRGQQSRLGQAQVLRQLGYLGKDHDDHRSKEYDKRRKEGEKRQKERSKEYEKRSKEHAKEYEKRDYDYPQPQARQAPAQASARPPINVDAFRQHMPSDAPAPADFTPMPSDAPILDAAAPPVPDTGVAPPPLPLPGMLPPITLVPPGMMRAMPGRGKASPGIAQPTITPTITPQMARLGKIAAAIGAGMFFL